MAAGRRRRPSLVMTVLEAVDGAFLAGGILLTAAALVLVLLESGLSRDGSTLRRWLVEEWQALQVRRWRDIPGRATERLLALFRRMIGAYFVDADRTSFFNAVFAGLVFVLIPGAALVNAVIGGRPFLVLYYASLVGALAVLHFAGETRRLPWLPAAAAVYLGISLVVVVPVYVLHSFTEVTIHNVFAHAVLKSVLVAVFWYMAAYALKLVVDVSLRTRGVEVRDTAAGRFFHDFLAGVPAAYVLTFLALLVGHLADLDSMPKRSWGLLLASVFCGSLSFAAALALMDRARGGGGVPALASAGGLAVLLSLALLYLAEAFDGRLVPAVEAARVLVGIDPGGGRTHLSPKFWVMHLPFLPVAVFAGGMALEWLAKLTAAALARVSGGGRIMREKPFFAAAAFCAWMSVLAFGITGAV
jgi:hypothetical protein